MDTYEFIIKKSPGGSTAFYKFGWKVHSYEYCDDLFKEQIGKHVYLAVNRITDECKCKKLKRKAKKIQEYLDEMGSEFCHDFKDFMNKINLFIDYFGSEHSVPVKTICLDYFRNCLLKRDLDFFPDNLYQDLAEDCEQYSFLLGFSSKNLQHYKKSKSPNKFALIFFIVLFAALLFAVLFFFIYRKKTAYVEV